MYRDTKYLTGLAQEKLLKKFKKVIDNRDSDLIEKALYNFLSCNTGFIAHYSMHGFREYYSGSNFRKFIEHFDQLHANQYPWLLNRNSDYYELLKDMADVVTAQASNIYAELDNKQRVSEVKYAKMILLKYGATAEQEEVVVQESLFAFTPDENGQMAMGF